MGPDDVEAVRAQGVTDQAISDALHVCFSFNLIDRLADAFGWHVQTEAEFGKDAKFLLKRGYRLIGPVRKRASPSADPGSTPFVDLDLCREPDRLAGCTEVGGFREEDQMRPAAPRSRTFSSVLPVALAALVACTASPGESGPGSSHAPVAEPISVSASPSGPAVRSASAGGPIDLSSLTGRIAFSAGPPHAEDVYVIDAEGTNLVRVTDDPAADFDPTFAPDGARIAYRHQPGDDPSTDIYVIGSTGSRPRDVTPNQDVADWGPAWSPDGTEIAWNSERDTRGRFRGFLMRPTGAAVKPLGADVWVEYPAWSPDGSTLAFMAQTPEGTDNYEVFVVRADGNGLRRLTDSPGSDGWPSWSPDGTQILFSSVRDDCLYSRASDCLSTGDIGPYHTLYVMDADGSGQARLSDAFAQIADWSPDGRYIVFEGQDGLSLVRADGTGLTTLPTGVGASAFPDWIA